MDNKDREERCKKVIFGGGGGGGDPHASHACEKADLASRLANGKSRLVLLLVWSILMFLLVYFREIQNVLPSIECWEGSLILSLLMRNINSNTLTFGIFQ